MYRGLEGWNAVKSFFDLDQVQAVRLFAEHSYEVTEGEAAARAVAARIRRAIKRELRRRSAIEPVIGHVKAEGHLGRRHLKGRAGDAANAIPAAVAATSAASSHD